MPDNNVKIKIELEDNYSENAKTVAKTTDEINRLLGITPAKAKEAGESVENVNKPVKEAKGFFDKLSESLSKNSAKFSAQAIVINLVSRAFNTAEKAVKNLGKFLIDSVFAFAESERGLNSLNASLKNR
jgi:DNA anti-recombination protein RmuC